MRVAAIGLLALFAVACGSAEPEPVDGIVLPYPADGSQYRMSEVCQHIRDNGYDVRGTIQHTFSADDFDDLLEQIPRLARAPIENYLSNGLVVEVEVRSLCGVLNR